MNPLKPVRFYGSALPRPRFLDGGDEDRICPPVPVNDSLLRWAKEANWAMGGLSFKKQRMQGKIEGRLSRLKNMDEDEEEVKPSKAGKKSKISKENVSPDSAWKKPSPKAMKRKGSAGVGRMRQRKDATESPEFVAKRSAPIHPVMGEWGEEDGPSPRRTSPRLHASSPLKPIPQTSPLAVSLSSPPVASQSIEFPVRRRPVESSPSYAGDSVSDVNWEEFRLPDRPLRRSSRVTSIRRSFREFAAASDSDHDN
ncbi:unnamed protein product [Calypogeia fissa]